MKITVFYADKVYTESEKWILSSDLPDGCYVREQDQGVSWYIVRHSGLIPINLSDVPKPIKATCLLTGQSI